MPSLASPCHALISQTNKEIVPLTDLQKQVSSGDEGGAKDGDVKCLHMQMRCSATKRSIRQVYLAVGTKLLKRSTKYAEQSQTQYPSSFQYGLEWCQT